ncbi:hypothetical protein RDABS01_018139 [Bienertia sinuspersici]
MTLKMPGFGMGRQVENLQLTLQSQSLEKSIRLKETPIGVWSGQPQPRIEIKRGLTENPLCQICNQASESIMHMLRDCGHARHLWSKLCPANRKASFFSCMDLQMWITQHVKTSNAKHPDSWSLIFPLTLWWIWKWRNHYIFNNGADIPWEKTAFIRAKIDHQGPNMQIIKLCKQLISKPEWTVIIFHCYRESNKAADWLANYGTSHSMNLMIEEVPYPELAAILSEDMQGVAWPRIVNM